MGIRDILIKDKKSFPILYNLKKRISIKNNKLIIKNFCLTKLVNLKNNGLQSFYIIFNDKKYNMDFSFKKGIILPLGYRLNKFKVKINLDDLKDVDIHNKIYVVYDNNLGKNFYSIFDGIKGKYKNGNTVIYNKKTYYLRQSIKNGTILTIRETVDYDHLFYKFKIYFGYFLSRFFCKKNYILMFEKESSRYEESASVLYEKLIDKGYNNIYYIINKDNNKITSLAPKYKKNLIYKTSLKNIIYFFKCQTFISTEAIAHCIQLRIANRLVTKKYNDKNNRFVFLQHGVMYMISLNSKLRTPFLYSRYKFHKTVVSSEVEAKHFIELGGFRKKDLYVCGLPKFDNSYKYDDADKIVIMPTWRRWEVNQAVDDYENTKYFKMIKRIVASIPKKYHDKLIILPHPLMAKILKHNDKYSSYLPSNEFSYDDILKKCSLLITDYSSISYDAYYRGSNVIFYWEEKEECLEKYGEGSKLMLNEKNVFGDVCYNPNELSKVIEKNYMKPHDKKYERRYKKIVEFSDNKNTDRLIKMLIKDKII